MKNDAPAGDIGRNIELTVSDVVYRGRGIGRPGGRVVFVAGVLPGERVWARIVSERKNYAEAVATRIVEPSPYRIEPACPLAIRPVAGPAEQQFCPGCAYQHMTYERETQLKCEQLRGFVERTIGAQGRLCRAGDASPSDLGYRNKIVLHAGAGKAGRTLGYVAADNETVLDVTRCPLAADSLNELLRSSRESPGFIPGLRCGARFTLRCTESDGAVCWVERAAADAGWLSEKTAFGVMKVPRASFWQVNPPVADMLVSRVMEMLRAQTPSIVVDLYCGAGLFSVAAAKAGADRVIGIDSDEAAVEAAGMNAKSLCAGKCEFIAATAEAGFRGIASSLDMSRTIVIADPTRRGMEKGLAKLLAQSRPAGIIYVSCAADTMARDAVVLVSAGYVLKSSRMLDMFPRTPYFESLTHFASHPSGKGTAAGGRSGQGD